MNYADKYILIELSELIVLSYVLSDTLDGLRCERNLFYKHPCLEIITQVSDSGPMGPLLFILAYMYIS